MTDMNNGTTTRKEPEAVIQQDLFQQLLQILLNLQNRPSMNPDIHLMRKQQILGHLEALQQMEQTLQWKMILHTLAEFMETLA